MHRPSPAQYTATCLPLYVQPWTCKRKRRCMSQMIWLESCFSIQCVLVQEPRSGRQKSSPAQCQMETTPAKGQDRALKPHFTVFQSISQVNADLIQKILTILHGMASFSLATAPRDLQMPKESKLELQIWKKCSALGAVVYLWVTSSVSATGYFVISE